MRNGRLYRRRIRGCTLPQRHRGVLRRITGGLLHRILLRVRVLQVQLPRPAAGALSSLTLHLLRRLSCAGSLRAGRSGTLSQVRRGYPIRDRGGSVSIKGATPFEGGCPGKVLLRHPASFSSSLRSGRGGRWLSWNRRSRLRRLSRIVLGRGALGGGSRRDRRRRYSRVRRLSGLGRRFSRVSRLRSPSRSRRCLRGLGLDIKKHGLITVRQGPQLRGQVRAPPTPANRRKLRSTGPNRLPFR